MERMMSAKITIVGSPSQMAGKTMLPACALRE
jgi:hypothetical protein